VGLSGHGQSGPEGLNNKLAAIASLSADQLAAAAKERQMGSLQPLIDEYTTTETTLGELKRKIQAINPEWNPPTLGEKIAAWVLEQEKPVTAEQIRGKFKADYGYGAIKLTLGKLTEKGTLTVKDNKYSVTE
jgi:hypothetical protein